MHIHIHRFVLGTSWHFGSVRPFKRNDLTIESFDEVVRLQRVDFADRVGHGQRIEEEQKSLGKIIDTSIALALRL